MIVDISDRWQDVEVRGEAALTALLLFAEVKDLTII